MIGADRITHGETPYGTMPSDCSTCDTYGPLTYITYVPFELAEPWHGTWDELNAAHGAATMFDVLCLAGMLALGWSISGLRLGMGLALAWAAFPFTAFALETNSNDSLVAAALIWGLVLFRHPLGRGRHARLRPGEQVRARRAAAAVEPQAVPARRRGLARGGAPTSPGSALAVVLTGWVLLLDGGDGLRAFWSRTIGYQLDRDSPFSIWGQHAGPAPGADRPDGAGGRRGHRRAALAAPARPADADGALGRPADRRSS